MVCWPAWATKVDEHWGEGSRPAKAKERKPKGRGRGGAPVQGRGKLTPFQLSRLGLPTSASAAARGPAATVAATTPTRRDLAPSGRQVPNLRAKWAKSTPASTTSFAALQAEGDWEITRREVPTPVPEQPADGGRKRPDESWTEFFARKKSEAP